MDYTKFMIFCSILVFNVLAIENTKFSPTALDMIKKGKVQYEILEERSKMPRYGECWKSAVKFLESGCKDLSENMQSDISLRFTNCFLEMSGHETYHCENDIKANLKRICINSMSDRAFNVYTEFYTHSQNICFFLRNQIWHEETEKTIDKLSSNSEQVSQQLEEAKQVQSILLEQQKESVIIQDKLLEHGASLMTILSESQQNLNKLVLDFKTSTEIQHRLLFDLFNRLSSFQNWVIQESSWLDTILFYTGGVIIILFFTSLRQTSNSRIPCLIILSVHAYIERYLCRKIAEIYSDLYIDSLNEIIYNYIWLLRKTTITIIIIFIVLTFLKFTDYLKNNNNLLLNIKKQNDIIINKLMEICEKMSNSDLNSNYDTLQHYSISECSPHQPYNYNSFTKAIDNVTQKISPKESQTNSKEINNLNEKNSFKPKSSMRSNTSIDVSPYLLEKSSKYNLRSVSRQGTPVKTSLNRTAIL